MTSQLKAEAVPALGHPGSVLLRKMQPLEEVEGEYLFELAPLGPGNLLSRCREGPGNWWGEGNEDLRVDARGRVVLVDPEMYYEVCKTASRIVVHYQPSVCSDTAVTRSRRIPPAAGNETPHVHILCLWYWAFHAMLIAFPPTSTH